MIHDLKPYPAMKDSGVPWLGKVPEHWEVRSLGSLTSAISHRGRADLPLLSVVRERGVIPRGTMSEDENHNFIPDDLSNYKVVRKGNLVINKMKAWQGSLGIAPTDGIVSPAYFVFDVHIANRRFGHVLLRSKTYVGFFGQVSDGVRIGQWDLSVDGMKRIPVAIPSPAEQTAIVRFLDHADRRIQRYIRVKQKLIKLLEEQKQAIIHRAVTRSLDPNVRLKPSGVEWLEEVPENWTVLPLKRWVSTAITDGPHETPPFLDDGIPFMSAESMVGGRFDFSRRRGFISRELHETYCQKCRPQRDDIFMCKSGATTGKVSIVETDEEFSVWSPLALIRVDPRRALPRLFFFVLQSRYVQRQVEHNCSYGTQPNLAMEAMERLVVVLPSIDEQRAIIMHLERETAPLINAIDRAQREISLLLEYRTRLIADVVTGKLDVRAVAASLQNETNEAGAPGHTETLAENDEDTAEVELEPTTEQAEA